MIKSTALLMDELKKYVNSTAKIRWLVETRIVSIVRVLYETDYIRPFLFVF